MGTPVYILYVYMQVCVCARVCVVCACVCVVCACARVCTQITLSCTSVNVRVCAHVCLCVCT